MNAAECRNLLEAVTHNSLVEDDLMRPQYGGGFTKENKMQFLEGPQKVVSWDPLPQVSQYPRHSRTMSLFSL